MPTEHAKLQLAESLTLLEARQALEQTSDSVASTAESVSDRRGLRLSYTPPRAFVEFVAREGESSHVQVFPRNLSTRGIAVMHRTYVHKDLPCRVLLPRLSGDWVRLDGRVLRCSHVVGKAHEVAIMFNRALRLVEYVQLAEAQVERAEEEWNYFRRIPSPTADRAMRDRWPGFCAVVAGRQFNMPILESWLSFVGMKVLPVDSLEQAKQIRQHLRMVAVPADPSVVASAKSRKFTAPIVAVGDVDDNDTYDSNIQAGADAFVATCGEFGDMTTVLQTLGQNALVDN